MKLTIEEFNKMFKGGAVAQDSDKGRYFTTDGTAHIPKTFWQFKGFATEQKAEQSNKAKGNYNGIIYHLI